MGIFSGIRQYSNGSLKNLITPGDYARTERMVQEQVDNPDNRSTYYVECQMVGYHGTKKDVISIGKLVYHEFYDVIYMIMMVDRDELIRRSHDYPETFQFTNFKDF